MGGWRGTPPNKYALFRQIWCLWNWYYLLRIQPQSANQNTVNNCSSCRDWLLKSTPHVAAVILFDRNTCPIRPIRIQIQLQCMPWLAAQFYAPLWLTCCQISTIHCIFGLIHHFLPYLGHFNNKYARFRQIWCPY